MYGGDPRIVERSLRETLGVLDDRFTGDILVMDDDRPTGGIVADLLDKLPDPPRQRAAEIERRIAKLKDRLTRACGGNGDFGGHFNKHLVRETRGAGCRMRMCKRSPTGATPFGRTQATPRISSTPPTSQGRWMLRLRVRAGLSRGT